MDKNIGKKLDNRYELTELIGVGGMADIYKATDIIENRTVAVKILKNEFAKSEDFQRRFRNESKAIALLSHKNIVKIYDVGFTEKIQYIVMEYIDGITLTEYIERQGVLKWRDAVHFTTQILRALQHAHDRGIVHRDIKSQNVMLMADGTIKVMDFGIAHFNRETDKTISEKAIGSVHYISPEQARGEMTDEKSDIYSVGVMLYEMLTGVKPFDGDNPVSIALKHMQTQPKPMTEINSSIPEGLEEITMKAMQKEPSKRYQTAGEMIKDIEEFKKNPSIVFEYKYFSTDGSTKYFDKVTPESAEAQSSHRTRKHTADISGDDADDDSFDEEEDDEDYFDDEFYYERRRRSPVLPILFALATAFVIMTAWLIYNVVTTTVDKNEVAAGEETKMPSLLNMTWDEVLEEYSDFNFTPVLKYDSDYPKNVVMNQSVMPGRSIRKNQNIEVTVSNGPKLVEVEDFTNKQINDVITMLGKQELKYSLTWTEDETVPKDCVIRTTPAAREFVQVGSTITCLVSTGPSDESTAVPQLINLSLASAQLRAKEYDILLTVIEEPSDEVEEGHVIRQNIEPTTIVQKNTLVEIVVSAGGAQEREATIKLSFNGSASGEFDFKYYIDGTLQTDKTETKNLSLLDNFTWTFSNSGVHEYAIRVRSTDTGAEGLLFNCTVDFTTDPPTKDYGDTFNPKVFKQLLSASPAGTSDEEGGENGGESGGESGNGENEENGGEGENSGNGENGEGGEQPAETYPLPGFHDEQIIAEG
ncbi:MAG: Stk1 family PASTA domain-containing Ser/Thr kinase [Ruminiclostridium sp.]|nr:Stk1 family PASTA domain-containing Ser/Thr kinase [Ruminiclostridium sp.]